MVKPTEPRRMSRSASGQLTDGPVLDTSTADLLTPQRRSQYLHWYEQMLLIRRFEEAAAEMYTRAKIGGYLHLNIGEEATVVGSMAALEPQDYVFSNYREHGHAIARGIEPKRIMAELFGKETGTCKGRGGSMHIFDAEKHFMGGYGIVGGALPLAVGAGYALEYQKSAAIVMTIFGEGATNIGSFHESLNMAELWKLPIVFLCVNNLYAMGKPVAEESAVTEIWRKACAYDMAGERVDGMDILAVYEATTRAVDRARQEHRPTLLEAVTYRYRGHSMADAGLIYRTTAEIEEWRRRDPIAAFRHNLESAGLAKAGDFDRIEKRVEQVVSDALEFAEQSPFPALATLDDDVYCERSAEGEGRGG
ncbi:MAG TPA: pyruvate dehydrogenase (acetyl-transferring) E1 component subunit alpha [Chloroflexota bacterium]|nr:pyruvate dehydrogenase (acetyl-transferring) E1 component subunit alpha [Chloroflexota bacterium]